MEKTVVQNYDFDDLKNHEEIFEAIEKQGAENFLAKPNMEGGGNNIFGKEGLDLVKGLTPEKRKNFIMMQLIVPDTAENIFVEGSRSYIKNTVSEISQYGLVISNGDKV